MLPCNNDIETWVEKVGRDFQENMKFKQIGLLNEGESFGELALLSNKPRCATVWSKETCVLAVIHKNNYQRILKDFKAQLDTKIDFLKEIPVFSHWTRSNLAKFTYYMKKLEFRWGQTIY
jgi:hypothetical protein